VSRHAVLTGPAIYECPCCGERQAGTRRCEDCNLFMRRLGPGGNCPHCDEPVLITDLLGTPQPPPAHTQRLSGTGITPGRLPREAR
jgi:hypothetical protein